MFQQLCLQVMKAKIGVAAFGVAALRLGCYLLELVRLLLMQWRCGFGGLGGGG